MKDLFEEPEFRVLYDKIEDFGNLLHNKGHERALAYLDSLPDSLFRGRHNAITAAAYFVNRPGPTLAIPYLLARGAQYPGRNDSCYATLPYQILHFYAPKTVQRWVSGFNPLPRLNRTQMFTCLMYILEDLEDALMQRRPGVKAYVTPYYAWVYPLVERVVKGVDPNAELIEGTYGKEFVRPLHMAVKSRQLKLVQLLLQAGADPFLADNEGELPAFYTTVPSDIGQLLQQVMASSKSPHVDKQPLGEATFEQWLQSLELTPRMRSLFQTQTNGQGHVLTITTDWAAVRIDAQAGHISWTKADETIEYKHGQRVEPDDRVHMNHSTPMAWGQFMQELMETLARQAKAWD